MSKLCSEKNVKTILYLIIMPQVQYAGLTLIQEPVESFAIFKIK